MTAVPPPAPRPEGGLLAPAAAVTAGNLASRLTGFARVLAVGLVLGTTFAGNTYQSANLVSNVVFELLAAGMLSAVLVPPFVALLDGGRRHDAERLAGAVLGLALLALGVVTAVAMLARPWIMRAMTVAVDDPAVRRQEIALGSFLLILFLPQVLLYAVGAVATGLLHAQRRFTAAAFAPVANNVLVIATMVAFAVLHGGRPGLDLSTGERLVLGVGTTAGVAAMSLIPLVALWRSGLRLQPRLDLRQAGLRDLGRSGVWAAVLLGCAQVLVVATLVLANRFEGGVVAYHIAFQAFLLPFALLAHPTITTLYPRLASAAAAGQWAGLRARLAGGVRTVVLLTLPAAAAMVLLAGPAGAVLQVGNVDAGGAHLVARLLVAYGLGVTGYACFQLLVRASYAAGDARTPALVGLGVAAAGSVLMAVMAGRGGIAGLGLGYSLAFSAGAAVLGLVLWRRLRPHQAPVPAGGVAPEAARAVPEGPVVAIVAAKDGAATVGEVVKAVRPFVDEVVVVDDGSADGTTAEARRAGAWVLRLPANAGKGGAVSAGVALAPHAGVYLLADADLGASAAATAGLLPPVLSGAAGMAVGVLPAAGRRGGFGLVRRIAATGIRRATGRPVRAPLSGQRAVRGDVLRALTPAPRFGLEVGLTIDARRAGERVVEVPIAVEHRHRGRSLAGFRHRAGQGADVVRALWPRLTRPATRLRLLAAVLILLVAGLVWPRSGPATVPLGRAERVLLVSVPGLRWDEVGTGRLPNLDRLAAGGAVAAMNVRTTSVRPRPVEAYATLGAGGRVRAGHAAEEAVDAGGRVVVTAAPEVRRAAGPRARSSPGALGEALHAAGLRTGVVNNADTPSGLIGLTGIDPTRRPAAVALMDAGGIVDAGSVGPDLLVNERGAPFSERADPDRVVARTLEALATADVVLVDPGDLDRAAALAGLAPPGYAARIRTQAMEWTDALLGRLAASVPAGTLVLAASLVPPAGEWRLTPVVASGPGVPPGRLHSPSTGRSGLVTLPDLAPTVLAALGAPVPPAMAGRPVAAVPGDGDLPGLARLDRVSALRERAWLPVALGFAAAQAALWGTVAWMTRRGRGSRRARAWASGAALAMAAFPLATLAFRATGPWLAGLGAPTLVLLPSLMAGAAVVARRARPSPLAPLAWILGATAWLLVADLATGGRLQVGAILGYAPQTSGRWSGLGNAGFAVLAASALVAAGLHVHHAPRRREALAAAAAFLALVTVVTGAPGLGGDVGGLLTLAPVAGLTVAAMAGRRLRPLTLLGAAGAAVAVAGAALAADRLRPPDRRTHLGRLAAEAWTSGPEVVLDAVERRARVNLDLLAGAPWGWLALLVVGGLLWALATGRLAGGPVAPGSPVRAAVTGALAAGLVGFVVNDSGPVVVALPLVAVVPVLILVALAPAPSGRPVLLEPEPVASGRPAPAPTDP